MDETTAYTIIVGIFALGLGAITAKIAADRKVAGNPFLWFIAGTFLAFIALPLAIFMSPDQSADSKICPKCAETIKRDAQVCRFCRHDFSPRPARHP